MLKHRQSPWTRAFIAGVLMSVLGSAASAEYIVGSYVLCRAEPAETGTVLGQLTTGDTVSVVERQRKWTRISRLMESGEPACWIPSKEVRQPTEYEKYVGHVDSPTRAMYNPTRAEAAALSAPNGTSDNPPISYVLKASNSGLRKNIKQSASRSKRTVRAYPSSDYCPCGTGRICIGPRGGRYCITSGGNKRYGV